MSCKNYKFYKLCPAQVINCMICVSGTNSGFSSWLPVHCNAVYQDEPHQPRLLLDISIAWLVARYFVYFYPKKRLQVVFKKRKEEKKTSSTQAPPE